MSVVLCQDWLSIGLWLCCDFCNTAWRTLRTQRIKFIYDILPCLQHNEEDIRKRGVQAIILGWGLTAALTSMLMVSPLAWMLPGMLRGFLFPQGRTSVLYLAVVWLFDALLDATSTVLLTHVCRCDFSRVFGRCPFSKTLRNAYLSSLTVVWAPCALGCFGWVFQHMCVAAFAASC